MKLGEYWPPVKEAGVQFWNHKGPRLGASLAFYTALSLSPLLIVVVAIAGLAFSEAAARGEIAHQIRDTVGEQGAQAIQSILAEHRSANKGILMTIVGLVTLLIGASGVFANLQDALDTIWDVKQNASSGIWGLVRDRLLSFTVVCGLASLLLVSLIIGAIMSALHGWLEDRLFIDPWVVRLANQVISFVLTTVLFAIIFKVLPHAYHGWSDVWFGALLTAVLFALGKYLIGLYLGQAAPGSAYGAAGSFVVLLIWIYYSTQILLFGAEFTQAYAHRCGTGLTRDLRHPSCAIPSELQAYESKPIAFANTSR
jgi:membrane protein